MANDIATYLKFANVQMAAEALYGLDIATPGTLFKNVIDPLVLTRGNTRSSKFTTTQAAEFADDWTVVEHISNTETGFSGTLLRARRSDAARGIVAGELVMSFRSTEFADDWARDSVATNDMEIKQKGWAFGQIADMEKWYAHLRTSYGADFTNAGNQFSVTGYSLGGHLATACVRPRRATARGLSQPNHYKNRSCSRNIYGGYSPKTQVKATQTGNKHA